jgi:hypothetical protein
MPGFDVITLCNRRGAPVQHTAPPRSASLAEFDSAIDTAEWRVRWCRLVLWVRVALKREAFVAREELAIEQDHLASLRRDRRRLARANGQHPGQTAGAG